MSTENVRHLETSFRLNANQKERERMALKNRFVGVRLEPEQQRKLILLSIKAGEPGNMSAGLRWALEQVKVTGTINAEILQQAEKQAETAK